MTCDELRDFYELYAMGVAEKDEKREIDEHLARNCPVCVPGVKQARRLASSLALAAPPLTPPPLLRERVLDSVIPLPERPTSVTWLTHAWATLAVLMLAAVLWYSVASRKLESQVAALTRSIADAQSTNAELMARNRMLTDAMALITLPDARQLVFGRPDREPPRGRIWVHPERGVLLLASNLPPAPAGKAYEMWVIPKGAVPLPAGLFNSDAQGVATHVWPQPVNVANTATIAVTMENESGVPAPTTAPLIAAGL
jgi:anti-sigma-K factor RskA